MSKVTTCLVLVFDMSDERAWLLESVATHRDVWDALQGTGEKSTLELFPMRLEEHEVYELERPLTREELQILERLKQEGLIDGFYVKDEISHE